MMSVYTHFCGSGYARTPSEIELIKGKTKKMTSANIEKAIAIINEHYEAEGFGCLDEDENLERIGLLYTEISYYFDEDAYNAKDFMRYDTTYLQITVDLLHNTITCETAYDEVVESYDNDEQLLHKLDCDWESWYSHGLDVMSRIIPYIDG